ncbi:ribosomal-protein-alanine N-acetyltransferase [candidate division WOR-1 bacterium RIFOXYA2_FULL_36_21]|uniref:[Ribosomal protein bS18]-alanine N-acetyltransferase n=1 Tax=candidate division WOR-1 bacterium RIFOXYB2_FULL_36_35 TaxID=1802578 RepID=A0A1F4S532_UNCSA|nr:MAG: ribosomal-protein-alanine N-acetyltransferase [candidate division WOR-1 bacterium RIFOXYA2_FULL_36_21]OGC14508.1 MAG: ribosomal-protein-alanine N-acetyltransferase [candidate division WOR-1 bacterium RIFOXYA12_FULL_36_13]OGC15487.1 MAG: ribosomal-protein-alanine N-acetyltransferase [candidate division WOR-1 bacterium RIFOXYB2_FULL_36_35]
MIIRKAEKKDFETILDIENKSFKKPWSKSQIESALKNIYVLTDSNTIKGFICFEAVKNEGHILHMAVSPSYRGKGFGEKMMEEILKSPCDLFFLEVREGNIAAQNLYKKFGFEIISKRKNYYQDNNENALVMKYTKQQKSGDSNE